MRFMLMFLLLAGAPAVAWAADVQVALARDWQFERFVDKFDDKPICRLRSTRKAVSFSFDIAPNGRAASVFTRDPSAIATGTMLTLRVDKNDSIRMPVRYDRPGVGAVGYGSDAEDWLKQMSVGKTLIARVASNAGGVDEEFSLDGFSKALSAHEQCVKSLP